MGYIVSQNKIRWISRMKQFPYLDKWTVHVLPRHQEDVILCIHLRTQPHKHTHTHTQVYANMFQHN